MALGYAQARECTSYAPKAHKRKGAAAWRAKTLPVPTPDTSTHRHVVLQSLCQLQRSTSTFKPQPQGQARKTLASVMIHRTLYLHGCQGHLRCLAPERCAACQWQYCPALPAVTTQHRVNRSTWTEPATGLAMPRRRSGWCLVAGWSAPVRPRQHQGCAHLQTAGVCTHGSAQAVCCFEDSTCCRQASHSQSTSAALHRCANHACVRAQAPTSHAVPCKPDAADGSCKSAAPVSVPSACDAASARVGCA
jgi:hypothetical protein